MEAAIQYLFVQLFCFLTSRVQLDDTKSATEHVAHDRAVADKNLKGLEAQLTVHQKKIEEHVLTLTDYESQNKRTASENANLYTKLEELLGNQGLLQKVNILYDHY